MRTVESMRGRVDTDGVFFELAGVAGQGVVHQVFQEAPRRRCVPKRLSLQDALDATLYFVRYPGHSIVNHSTVAIRSRLLLGCAQVVSGIPYGCCLIANRCETVTLLYAEEIKSKLEDTRKGLQSHRHEAVSSSR